MKKATILFLIIIAGSLFAQTEEQIQAYNDYMTPGPEHKLLSRMEGEWNYKMYLYMAPGQDPLEATGTATGKVILDGRYLKLLHEGVSFGMPYQAEQVIGYDRVKAGYITNYIDNMGTGFLIATGPAGQDGKSIEMKGTFAEPMTKSDTGFRCVQKFMDDGSFLMELYVTFEGKESKTWETRYTRK